jgi:hypothetical protein
VSVSIDQRSVEVGFDAALRSVEKLLEEKHERFIRIGHPAATNKARLLEELLTQVGALQYTQEP